MKKRFSLMISCFLFMLAVLPSSLVSAEGFNLTVSAQVDNSTKDVNITGTISGEADQQVSVVVLNPSGNVDFMDQVKSDSDGYFNFQYTLDESEGGTYTVKVGGSGVSNPVTTSFTYQPDKKTKSSSKDRTDRNTDDEQGIYMVDEDKLKPTNQNSHGIIIDLPDEIEAVSLPHHAGELLDNNSLTIQRGTLSVTIHPEVLAKLMNLADDEELEDARIILELKPKMQENMDEMLCGDLNEKTMRVAGQVIYFELSMIMKDGLTKSLPTFPQPIETALSYDEDADKNLLGVYYCNDETGKWEYMGGQVDEDNQRVIAHLSHFSTFAILEYDKNFADVPEDYWASRAIKTLSAKHAVSGTTDTEFSPRQAVTRAEFIAILIRALGLGDESDSEPFKDVPSTAWYVSDVAAAYHAGIVSGQSANLFLPNATMTREEMAAMLVRAYEYASGEQIPDNEVQYTDQDEIAVWAKPYVNRAIQAKLMIGPDNHRFLPKSFTTRAEAAQAVYNLLMQMDN